MEQEEYGREEINWSYIEFVDNQDVLDLIEKVFGYCSFRWKFSKFFGPVWYIHDKTRPGHVRFFKILLLYSVW